MNILCVDFHECKTSMKKFVWRNSCKECDCWEKWIIWGDFYALKCTLSTADAARTTNTTKLNFV